MTEHVRVRSASGVPLLNRPAGQGLALDPAEEASIVAQFGPATELPVTTSTRRLAAFSLWREPALLLVTILTVGPLVLRLLVRGERVRRELRILESSEPGE